MNNFNKLKNMDIEAFAKWLDEHGQVDGSPWMDFFNESYCKKCESIKVKTNIAEEKLGLSPFKYGGTVECAWCELHGKCKYFKKLKEIPSNIDIIKMWLNEKCKDLLAQYMNGEIISENVFCQQIEDIKQIRNETANKYYEEVNKSIDCVPNMTRGVIETLKVENKRILFELKSNLL